LLASTGAQHERHVVNAINVTAFDAGDSLSDSATQLLPMRRDELAEMLKPLQSKTMFVHYFDRWSLPFSDGVPDQVMGRTRRFARDVAAIDKNIKVVVPKFF